jgi:ABC-2 type transport system permease protein
VSPAVPIVERELRDRRTGIIGWSIAYVAMVLLTTLSFPAVRDTFGVDEFVNQLPAALKALLGSQDLDFTSGAGYVNSRLIAFTFPVMLLIFVIGFGSRVVAGEHEDGRLDLVIAYPILRRTYLLARTGVMVGVTTGFVLLALGALWLTGLPVDLGLGPAELWPAGLMLIAFACFYGGLALLVGCVRLERRFAMAIPGGIALAGWLVNSLAAVATWLEPVRAVSPLWWFTRNNPLRDGLDTSAFLLLAGGALIFIVAALEVFDRRDLAA